MSSFFNMYIEYTDRNLKEYNKILITLISCQTLSQFDVVKNMAEQFARNCDHRQKTLKKNAWKDLLCLSTNGFRNYYSYVESTSIQIENVINHCNEWVHQYDEWLADEKKKEEEIELKKKTRKYISGFTDLFKKKRKKKGTN